MPGGIEKRLPDAIFSDFKRIVSFKYIFKYLFSFNQFLIYYLKILIIGGVIYCKNLGLSNCFDILFH